MLQAHSKQYLGNYRFNVLIILIHIKMKTCSSRDHLEPCSPPRVHKYALGSCGSAHPPSKPSAHSLRSKGTEKLSSLPRVTQLLRIELPLVMTLYLQVLSYEFAQHRGCCEVYGQHSLKLWHGLFGIHRTSLATVRCTASFSAKSLPLMGLSYHMPLSRPKCCLQSHHFEW